MPLDPRIVLGVESPPAPNPLQALSAVAQLQAVRENAELRREQVEIRRQAAEAARTQRMRQQEVDAAWEEATSVDPATGKIKIDHARLLSRLPGALIPAVKKELDADEEHILTVQTKRHELSESENKLRTSMADTIVASGYHPVVIGVQLKRAHDQGILNDDQFAQLSQAPPEAFKALIEGSRTAAKPELVERVLPDGRTVKEYVVPKVGEQYPQAPKTTGLELKPVIDPKTGQAIYVRESEAIGQRVPPPIVAPSFQWAVPPGGTPTLMTPQEIRAAGASSPATARPATEGERKAAGFYSQMDQALANINKLEAQLSTKDLYQIQSLPQEGIMGAMNRMQMSDTAKRYVQAFNQFTEARLRPVSGAAIAASEYARDRATYAKQYAETPDLAAQRLEARTRALDALRVMAGPAADEAKVTPPGKPKVTIKSITPVK